MTVAYVVHFDVFGLFPRWPNSGQQQQQQQQQARATEQQQPRLPFDNQWIPGPGTIPSAYRGHIATFVNDFGDGGHGGDGVNGGDDSGHCSSIAANDNEPNACSVSGGGDIREPRSPTGIDPNRGTPVIPRSPLSLNYVTGNDDGGGDDDYRDDDDDDDDYDDYGEEWDDDVY